MEKTIDWLVDKGIPKDKFIITSEGMIYYANYYSYGRKSVKQHQVRDNHIVTATLCGQYDTSVRKAQYTTISVARAVLIAFGKKYPFDLDEKYFHPFHKNGNLWDNRIDNLTWAFRTKSNAPILVDELETIIDFIKNNLNLSIQQLQIQLSIKLKKFVPIQTLRDITNTHVLSKAYPVLSICGFNSEDVHINVSKSIPSKDEIRALCLLLNDTNGDVDDALSIFPQFSRRQVLDIRRKAFYKDISDAYFKEPLPRPTSIFPKDIPGEKWVRIHNEPELRKYYISTKGRVLSAEGNIIHQFTNEGGICFVCLLRKGKPKRQVKRGVAKLVASHFLPLPYDDLIYHPLTFSPHHIDGNTNNNDVTNLEWVMKGSVYTPDDILYIHYQIQNHPEMFCKQIAEKASKAIHKFVHWRLVYEIKHGLKHQSLIKQLDDGRLWRPFRFHDYEFDIQYYASDNGDIKTASGMILKPFTHNHANYVYLKTKYHGLVKFRVSSCVAAAFLEYPGKGWKIRNKDGNLHNDRLDNLEYRKK